MRSPPSGEDQQQATNQNRNTGSLPSNTVVFLHSPKQLPLKIKNGELVPLVKRLSHKRGDLNSNHHQRALNKVGHGYMLTQPETGRSQELPSWLVQSACELQGQGEAPVSIRGGE